MTLRSMIPAAALLVAIASGAGVVAAAPMGAAQSDSAMPVQQVDWRGGPRGEWFPTQGSYGSAPYGYAYGYDYGPGDSTYGYDPGYYDYGGNSYSGPGYRSYGYTAPGRDAAYCAQRYRSYDPASGTYMGYDGVRRSCP